MRASYTLQSATRAAVLRSEIDANPLSHRDCCVVAVHGTAPRVAGKDVLELGELIAPWRLIPHAHTARPDFEVPEEIGEASFW